MAEVGISRSGDGIVAVTVHLSLSDLTGLGFSDDQLAPAAQTPEAPAIEQTGTAGNADVTVNTTSNTTNAAELPPGVQPVEPAAGAQPEPEQPGDSPEGTAPPPVPPPGDTPPAS